MRNTCSSNSSNNINISNKNRRFGTDISNDCSKNNISNNSSNINNKYENNNKSNDRMNNVRIPDSAARPYYPCGNLSNR